MSDNADALRVINAERDKDYYSLLYKLSARFKESSEVERERLVDELNAAKRERNETIRAFYGRLSTIATELRTIFDRPVQDEDIKRVLLRELSEASKNNFLHLEMMPKYEKQFNELCLEVIKRDEILQKTIGNSEVVNNVTSDSVILAIVVAAFEVDVSRGTFTRRSFKCYLSLLPSSRSYCERL